MNKKYSGLLIAIVILFVLGTGYAFLVYHNRSLEAASASARQENSITIPAPDAAQISSFQLSNENTSFTLTKSNDSWICVQDRNFPLSDSLAGEFVNGFTALNAVRDLGRLENVEEYGFSASSPTVSITTTDDTSCTFTLGSKNSTTGDYYLRREDTKDIYTINEASANLFQKTLNDLAEIENLPSVSSENVTALAISENDQTLSFQSSQIGSVKSWQVSAVQNADSAETGTSPRKAVVNTVTALVDKLGSLAFDSFADYKEKNLEKYGLKNPSMTITVNYITKADASSESETSSDAEASSDTEKFILYVGSQTDEGAYYVKLSNNSSIYTISASTLSSFQNLTIDDFLQKETTNTD